MPEPRRHPAHPAIGPSILALLAVFLWASGREILAVVAFGVGFLGLQAVTLSSDVAERVARVSERIGTAVAHLASFVLLWPLHVLVITPIGLVRRGLGSSPIETRPSEEATSYWSNRRGDPTRLASRQFSDERSWAPLTMTRGARRGVVVKTVAAVLAVQALVVGVVVLVRDGSTPEAQLGGVASPSADQSAALEGLDWVPEAAQETTDVTSGLVYSPFTGASLRDYEGKYVNVTNRVRKSYEPAVAPGQPVLDVWFLGGSTMFGFDLQRDLHTIPSEFVRLAEQDGVAVRARNYGSPGYVNYQETMLLALLTSGGERPDLVVFYDGINDKSLALANAYGQVNPAGEPSELGAHQIRQALAESGIIPGGSSDPPPPLVPSDSAKPVTPERLAEDTIGVYTQGIEVSRALARSYGFEVSHFWQPDLYSRDPLDPGELELLDTLNLDEMQFETMSALSAHIRRTLPAGVIDISDAFDEVEGPVLSDFIHTNEVGAAAVARTMYAELGPKVLELSSR